MPARRRLKRGPVLALDWQCQVHLRSLEGHAKGRWVMSAPGGSATQTVLLGRGVLLCGCGLLAGEEDDSRRMTCGSLTPSITGPVFPKAFLDMGEGRSLRSSEGNPWGSPSHTERGKWMVPPGHLRFGFKSKQPMEIPRFHRECAGKRGDKARETHSFSSPRSGSLGTHRMVHIVLRP